MYNILYGDKMLEKINKTNDVCKLNSSEKIQLASEIREYILDIVSKNGGHLASNLGCVELTIALESVFDLNKDKIVWDVGHQCYTHKILNGRKDSIKTLRKFRGISGFPKTSESFTDCFNTGHSSTSISAAMGISQARDLKKKDYNVVAVIGDGALTGGMAMEALNHVGSTNTRMIVILNDNEMSISKNIGGINKLLTRIRTIRGYTKSNNKVKKLVNKIPIVGKVSVDIISRTKNSLKQLIIPGMYFEEIGFRYLGPVDGHNIDDMEKIFSSAKELDGPTLIHVITKKGKGYSYAEENPSKFHGISPFDIVTGEVKSKSSSNFSKVFGRELVRLASKNKRIVAITAAMKDGVGMGEFASKFPDRFYDVGIAEGHAITFAAGLAASGMIPVVSIYSSFYQRCYDQVIHDVCIQKLHVIMCVDRAGIVGADGDTHQGLYDMAFFRSVPNLVIFSPRNYKELSKALEFAVKYDGPIVIRYPRGSEDIDNYSVSSIKYGKSQILEVGEDISIICIGKSVSKGIQVYNKYKEANISCDLINCRFLKPIDSKCIINSIKKTGRVIVIEDGTIVNGLCTSIKEIIVDNDLKCRIKCYAYPDKFIEHGSVVELEKKYKLNSEFIFHDSFKYFNIER